MNVKVWFIHMLSLSLSLFPHTMCAINLFTTKEVLEAPFALVKGQQ